MWKRATFLLLGVMLIGGLGAVALAQDSGLIGHFVPFVVDIEQAVPVTVSVPVVLEGGETMTATVPLTVSVALQVRVSSVNSVILSSGTTPTVAIATGETDTPPIQYVVLKNEADTRLSPVIIEGIHDDIGNFMLHIELKSSTDIASGQVALRCYGPQHKLLCNISSLLRPEPNNNLAGYVETEVPFEEVEWFELYWRGDN